MTTTSVKVLSLIICLSTWSLLVGLTGCAGERYTHRIDEDRTADRDYNQSTDQRMEDSRTAERVREALAAGVDYKYDGVKVIASDGVVQLSGLVNTSAQRTSAGEVTSKVAGVKSVENNLTVKE